MDKRGPLFDGRAEKAVADAADSMEKSVATLGASMVRTRMNQVFKQQTPFYRFLNVAAEDPPGWKIWDQNRVRYGWWLEGVSRMNRVTRFKGYGTYRLMTQVLRRRAKAMGQAVIVRYMGRMGG